RRNPAGPRHVRQNRRARPPLKGRAPEIFNRRMAPRRRHHRAARDYPKRTRSGGATAPGGQKGGALIMACIEARGLRKAFKTTTALDGINLRVEEGRILGLIGPNGAGKTTALNAILGLTSYEGELKVLGRDPWAAREELMRDVSFI